MTQYEYGIDWKRKHRREETPHRTGMTLEEAQEFMTDPGFDWSDVFVIIRRPIGAWEDVQDVKKEAKYNFLFNTWPADKEYECSGGVLPTPPDLDTSVIGKNCDQRINLNQRLCCCGCGRSAGVNGYCGPSGCIDIPG